MEDRCVCCGDIIPEGSHICLRCMHDATYPTPKSASNILDVGYVIVDRNNGYILSHNGIYRTRKGAQKECDRINSQLFGYRVVGVKLIIDEGGEL